MSVSTIETILKSTEKIRLKLNKKNSCYRCVFRSFKGPWFYKSQNSVTGTWKYRFWQQATNSKEKYLRERKQRVVLNGIESDWKNMKIGVSQYTILGPLLFNIYVNDLAKNADKDCTVVWYKKDTFLFTSDTDEILPKTKLEHNISKIIYFLQNPRYWWISKNRIYCVQHQEEVNKYCSECRKWKITESNSVKYLGVIIDSKLKFDAEMKKNLQRIACETKVLNTLSENLPEKRKILLLNAIVISHLHYSALVLTGLQQSLLTILEKQLNCRIKTIFIRRKYDRSTDLKVRNKYYQSPFSWNITAQKIFSLTHQQSSSI